MAETDLGAEFVLTDEHRDLRTAVRRFCAAHLGEEALRRVVDGAGFGRTTWRRLASELGIVGLAVPEELGGAGGTLVDQAIAVEELGAVLATGPLVGTVFLAVPLLVAAPASPARDELLAGLCSGEVTAAAALTGSIDDLALGALAATAEETDGAWHLTGDLGPVLDAGACDVLVVTATTPAGPAVFAVAAADVDVAPLVALDLTRPLAAVSLDRVRGRLLVGPDDAEAAVATALRTACVLLAAEQVGAAQHLLDLTVAYAGTRLQFGRAIGTFQAVKHQLADLLVAVEHGRSAAHHAAWAHAARTDPDGLEASIAQAVCSPMLSRVAAGTVQLHGGIGFTWEHQAHLYFKRAAADSVVLGSAEAHRERVARHVLDPADPTGAPPVAAGRPLTATGR